MTTHETAKRSLHTQNERMLFDECLEARAILLVGLGAFQWKDPTAVLFLLQGIHQRASFHSQCVGCAYRFGEWSRSLSRERPNSSIVLVVKFCMSLRTARIMVQRNEEVVKECSCLSCWMVMWTCIWREL